LTNKQGIRYGRFMFWKSTSGELPSYAGEFIDKNHFTTALKNALVLNPTMSHIFFSEEDKFVCATIVGADVTELLKKFGPKLYAMQEAMNQLKHRGNMLLRGFIGDMFCHGIRTAYSDNWLGPYVHKAEVNEKEVREFALELWNLTRKYGLFTIPEAVESKPGFQYPGTNMEELFFSINASLAQHCDPGEAFPSIGLFGNLFEGSVVGGHFVFSRRNLIVPFNPNGTILIWNSHLEEHGTSLLMTDGAVRFGSALVHKREFDNIKNL